MESAVASREAGMATVMGAPNVVRGGSHSGNVAASRLADAGLLDILSSDYVPASLLLGAFQLAGNPGVAGLPGAIKLVSKSPANALGLFDRGEIAPGKRADLIRVGMMRDQPVIREVWRTGRRVA
jgi:alpha-D-ribose 1-methylphosphonate 5-triphosphate diphosphatase